MVSGFLCSSEYLGILNKALLCFGSNKCKFKIWHLNTLMSVEDCGVNF